MSSYMINLEYRLSDELLTGILDTAHYSGIEYWGLISKVVRTGHTDDNPDGNIVELQIVDCEHDPEDGRVEVWVVDFTTLTSGIRGLLEANTNYQIDALRRAIAEDDGGEIDADLADCIIQQGLFDEQVYS